jgi:hypothetical protein
MGLINNDSVETPSGLSASGCYIKITTLLSYKNEDGTFNVVADYSVYKDEASKLDKSPIEQGQVSIVGADITANLYEQSYAQLKTIYTNYTDVL